MTSDQAIEHLAVTRLAELAAPDAATRDEWIAGNEQIIWNDILARGRRRPSVRRRLGVGTLYKVAAACGWRPAEVEPSPAGSGPTGPARDAGGQGSRGTLIAAVGGCSTSG